MFHYTGLTSLQFKFHSYFFDHNYVQELEIGSLYELNGTVEDWGLGVRVFLHCGLLIKKDHYKLGNVFKSINLCFQAGFKSWSSMKNLPYLCEIQ